MALHSTAEPLSDEAQIKTIEDYVERRRTIIIDCTNPDTGLPFEKLAHYCEAITPYRDTMSTEETSRYSANLRRLG